MQVTKGAQVRRGGEAIAAGGARARRRSRASLTPYLYLAPMVLMVCAFLLYPAADTLWLSFTNWDGLHVAQFVALGNYLSLPSDPAFVGSIVNTVIWVVGLMVFQVLLGLLLAVAVNASPLAELFKRILYVPATISGGAIGVIWYFVFDPSQGILSTTLRGLHLGFLTREWLGTPPYNTMAMIVAAIWQGLGPVIILYLVGLQSIPRDPLEAAQVDGAGAWRLFRYVTLPLLRPMTVVVVGINLINSFKVFDIIWVMTQGGPYRSSETLAVTMYRDTFVSFQLGYGSSVAMVLTLVVFVVSIPYIRSMFRRVEVQ